MGPVDFGKNTSFERNDAPYLGKGDLADCDS
jgi:hypothetical protein